MKTFKDLKFKQHDVPTHFDIMTEMVFKNGYGISVISGRAARSSESAPYEAAVLYMGEITYNSGLADDVLGWLSADDVSDLMIKIQNLEQ